MPKMNVQLVPNRDNREIDVFTPCGSYLATIDLVAGKTARECVTAFKPRLEESLTRWHLAKEKEKLLAEALAEGTAEA